MTEEIWSPEYIKQNPELAYVAIKSLQAILSDLENEIKLLSSRLEQIETPS